MYIGSTDKRGMHHLVWEIIDNSVDEIINGYGNKITVKINADGSITIADNGRGVPIGKHKSGIRISWNHGLFAPPPCFSQLITSFFVS